MCNCDNNSVNLSVGPPGSPGLNGTNGTDGTDGTNGSDGVSIAFIVTAEPPGVNCTCGGNKIELGPDADNDGIPFPITETFYVCGGCDDSAVLGTVQMWDGDITDAALFVQAGPTTGLGIGVMNKYAYCNGNNGTPDMRGSFPICTGQNPDPAIGTLGTTYALGDIGGIDVYQLQADELAAHLHPAGTLSTSSNGAHTHTVANRTDDGSDTPGNVSDGSDYVFHGGTLTTSSNGAHTHSVINSTANNTPANQPHQNLPPLYAIHFIKRITS